MSILQLKHITCEKIINPIDVLNERQWVHDYEIHFLKKPKPSCYVKVRFGTVLLSSSFLTTVCTNSLPWNKLYLSLYKCPCTFKEWTLLLWWASFVFPSFLSFCIFISELAFFRGVLNNVMPKATDKTQTLNAYKKELVQIIQYQELLILGH